MDSQVQAYIRNARDRGCPVTSSVVIAAARGVVKKTNRSLLEDNGGPLSINKSWAKSFLSRMGYVKRKGTTTFKVTPDNFEALKNTFLEQIKTTVEFENIPLDLIFNWDQTGLNFVPVSKWTMEKEGAKRVEIKGFDDKRQLTAVFAATISGKLLPMQLIYQGKTNQCHPKVKFPNKWHITHSPNHWSNETTMVNYITKIIIPYVKNKRKELGKTDDQVALAIFDEFKGQVTQSCSELLTRNNILFVRIPPNCTDRLQPLDISLNKAAKDFMKQQFQEWYSERIFEQLQLGVDVKDLQPVDLKLSIMKHIGGSWIIALFDYLSSKPDIVTNGFRHAGISGTLNI